MLDESRRDDVMYLVRTYDELIARPDSGERDGDLARVQKWLCRVTGMPTVSAAVDAARRLTRHEVSFIAPVRLYRPKSGPGGQPVRCDEAPVPPPRRPRRKADVVPPLDDETAFQAEKLLAERDELVRTGRKLTVAEKAHVKALGERILVLTGFATLKAARFAVRSYVARRDGKRRFVPTKTYAQDGQPRRPLPPITVVRGGAPGSGSRR